MRRSNRGLAFISDCLHTRQVRVLEFYIKEYLYVCYLCHFFLSFTVLNSDTLFEDKGMVRSVNFYINIMPSTVRSPCWPALLFLHQASYVKFRFKQLLRSNIQ